MLESGKRYFLYGYHKLKGGSEHGWRDRTEDIESIEWDENEQKYSVVYNDKGIFGYNPKKTHIIDENIWNYFIKYVEFEKENCKSNKRKMFETRQANLELTYKQWVGESVLSHYINPVDNILTMHEWPLPIICPFECNFKQYEAIKNACTSPLSVIEGASGTGKTQTILNIIANFLIRTYKPRILLVLANNSVLENMQKKVNDTFFQYTSDNDMGFIDASEKTDLLENIRELEPYFSESLKGMEDAAKKRHKYVEQYLNPVDSIEYEVDLHILDKEFELEKAENIKGIEELREKSVELLRLSLYSKSASEVEEQIQMVQSFSAIDCVAKEGKELLYDYVIIDEAAQIDIIDGVQALSCGRNAVIVGDSNQLNHIANKTYKIVYEDFIKNTCKINEYYNCAGHNFLDSVKNVVEDIPKTELLEHYRCHPAIIQFCNEQFYENKLLIMTEWDKNVEVPIEVSRTKPGNYEKYITNLFGGDEVYNEEELFKTNKLLSKYNGKREETGIISPYHCHAKEAEKELKMFSETVHKFQGREMECIVLNLVRDKLSKDRFVNEDKLINTAISRAKQHLCIIMSGNEIELEGIIGKLKKYVDGLYSKKEIRENKHSILEWITAPNREDGKKIIQQYPEQLYSVEKYPKKEDQEKRMAEQLFEILLQHIIKEYNDKFANRNIDLNYDYEYLLKDLISEEGKKLLYQSEKGTEKKVHIEKGSSVDFILWNNDEACMAVEIDGFFIHEVGENMEKRKEQKRKDALKDNILEELNLPLFRCGTRSSNYNNYQDSLEEALCKKLDEVLGL